MNNIECRIYKYDSSDYEQMKELRNEILRKPLGLPQTAEDLAADPTAVLMGAFENDKMIACCRLMHIDENTIQLGAMAVAENFQGKGIGRLLVEFAERYISENNYTNIFLNARLNKEGFYKTLGYSSVGEIFTKATLPHIRMEKKVI